MVSALRARLRRSLGGGQDLAAELRQLSDRVAELDRGTRAELDRHHSLIREQTADLTERITALEQRLAALEARSRDQ